ncbi:hypothetical protein ACFO5R_21010 [Halosolutus amylolyticus]|uniref:Uncharacterized protein n=1 Tax=Halosolutus amylolyticus TaxID=2932267 RepID=A0ABD5PV84_9EURY|nr:hypothetical protein [Halosolutus amylolyticus]
MGTNPVEENFVTRFLLGFAVIVAMAIGGRAVAAAFVSAGIPYANWLGVAVGAVLVFAAFTVLYRRYDASYGE